MTVWECSVCWQVIEEHRVADIRKHRISHIRENDWANLEKSVSISKTRHWLNEQTEQTNLSATQNSVGDSPCTSFESPGSNFSVDETTLDTSQKKAAKFELPVPVPVLALPSETASKPRRSLYKCDFCEFKAKRDGIVRHVKDVHEEKFEKWRTKESDVLYLPCDVCDQFFASMDDRAAHFKNEHLKPESLSRPLKRGAIEIKDAKNLSPADSVRLFVRKKLQMRNPRSKSKTRESLLNLCKEYKEASSSASEDIVPKEKIDVISRCPRSRTEAFFLGRLSVCPYHPCEASFKNSLALEAHVSRKHTDKWDHFMRSLDRPYQCPTCSWRYSSSQSLREHQRKYKKTCASYIPTSECSRELIFEESSLKSGEELPDNPADRRPYIVDDLIDRARRLCPFNEHFHCQFRFSSEDKFADHIQKWHPDRYDEYMRCIDRPFICESCDFRFRDIDELRLHKQLRQGVCSSYNRDLHDIYIRKRPRSDCIEFNDSFSECDSDKIFEDSLLLENEFKDEADEVKEEPEILDEENNPPKLPKIKIKTYSELINCPYCDISYNLDEDSRAPYKLLTHISAHHPQMNAAFRRLKTTLLPYQCNVCRFCFVDSKQLAEHDCEKSLDVPSVIEVMCDHCGAKLCSEPRHSKDMIDSHMKKRHRDQYLQFRMERSEYFTVKCPGCLFYFSSEKALHRHQENCLHSVN